MKFNIFIAGMIAGVMLSSYCIIYSLKIWEIYFIPMSILGFLGIIITLFCDKEEELTQKLGGKR